MALVEGSEERFLTLVVYSVSSILMSLESGP